MTTCGHGRGRTVRCRRCEQAGVAYGRSPLTDAREALEGLAALEGQTVEVAADGPARRGFVPFGFTPRIGDTYTRGILPVAPAGAISTFTEQVARERAAAIEAMLDRSRAAARAHCRATGEVLADFPILATDGQNPLEAVERLELRCGACQTPIDGLLFSVRLQVDREPVAR